MAKLMAPMRTIVIALFITLTATSIAHAELVNIGTAGSIITGSPQPPDEPPGAVGAPASVNKSRMNSLLKFPPWSGFPCQVPGGTDLCGGGGNNGGGTTPPPLADACPVKEDVTGTFGKVYSVSGNTSTTLPCGGVVTLDNTETSVVPAPDRLAITDGSSARIAIYEFVANPAAGQANFKLAGNVQLPNRLCSTDNAGDVTESPMPIPGKQMVLFKKGSPTLVLRATQNNANAPAEALQADGANPPVSSSIYNERFLTLPVKNGAVDFDPSECQEEADWYKPRPQNTGDVWLQPSTSSSATCQDTNVSINSGNCNGSMMYMNLDTPALVHQPGRSATFYTIEGRPEMFTVSTDTSFMMVPPGSAIRLGSAQGDYVLSEGGYMELKSGNILRMSAPATIDPGSGRVTLSGGGYIETPSGETTTTIGAGNSIVPQAEKPYNVYPNRKIILPAGMVLPVKPNGTLRLPIDIPN